MRSNISGAYLYVLVGLWISLMAVAVIGCQVSDRSAMPVEEQVVTTPIADERAVASLDQASGKMYELAKAGQITEARAQLESIVIRISQGALTGVVNFDGMHEVTEVISRAREVFQAADYDQNQGIRTAAQIRLLFDALSSRGVPMWKSYDRVLSRDAEQIEEAAMNRKPDLLKSSYSQLVDHFWLVKPAIAVSTSASLMVKSESFLLFLKNLIHQETPLYEEVHGAYPQLQAILNEIFRQGSRSDEPVYVPVTPNPPFWYWVAGIGSFIVLALVYSGYRRYRYERHAVVSYHSTSKQRARER